jgi:hypothetical protein
MNPDYIQGTELVYQILAMTGQILRYHDFVEVISQTAFVTVDFIFNFPISQTT